MAVAEAHGGWGASLLDLALVAEQVGRALAPAPVIEAQVAARLLAAVGLRRRRSTPSAACSRASSSSPSPSARPADGVAALAPAGAVCRRRDRPRRRPPRARPRRRRRPHGRSPTWRRRRWPTSTSPRAAAPTLATGADGRRRASRRRSTSGSSSPPPRWSASAPRPSRSACEYATERQAFGVPIGSFQGVAHPLADDATALDGARLLAHEGGVGARRRGRPGGASWRPWRSPSPRETAETATYRRAPLPRRLRLHARVRRPAPLPAGPGWARVWGDAEAADRRAAAGPLRPRPRGAS